MLRALIDRGFAGAPAIPGADRLAAVDAGRRSVDRQVVAGGGQILISTRGLALDAIAIVHAPTIAPNWVPDFDWDGCPALTLPHGTPPWWITDRASIADTRE
jgi:hypothetical protein